MRVAELVNVRLIAFKSFRGAHLPIAPVTVLTGRNNSGKSNALDAVEVLSRLATGEDIADALDGRRREGGPVRGGSRGCAPHGTKRFSLGCNVRVGHDNYLLDFTVQVEPELRIIHESLSGPAPAADSGKVQPRTLLTTQRSGSSDTFSLARIFNGKTGPNPVHTFRNTRLLTSQLPARLAPENRAEEAVLEAATAVTAALRGVFHLDPVPHLMREYVPGRDTDVRRTGENLSAALARLAHAAPDTFARLQRIVREVAGEPVRGVETTTSSLGDVMLALREGPDDHQLTSAREMSDGLLRFLAVATALLSSSRGPTRGLDIDSGIAAAPGGPDAGVLLVIEELESGLHPSQAVRVLDLIREASEGVGTRTALTTHSPALLNAATGALNESVFVCYRDQPRGQSRIKRLTELPGYAEAMASGRIGDAISLGHLTEPVQAEVDFTEFRRVLGLA